MSEIIEAIKKTPKKASTYLEEALEGKYRPVKLVTFHAQIFWLEGAIQDTNLSAKKFDGLKMFWIPGDGLLLERRGATYTVPEANVIGMEHG